MLSAQNLELILTDKKQTEKDLWKKERINYYFDSKDVNEAYPESFYYRGQEKLEEGLYEEAITDFKRAIVNERLPAKSFVDGNEMPSRKTAYMLISGCFQQMNQSDSALFYCRKSIEEDRYSPRSHIQLAYILIEAGRFSEADKALKEAEEFFPGSKDIPYTRAELYLQQNKISKARKYLKKAIAIDPDFEEANIQLATIYLDQRDLPAAMKILNKAIKKGTKPVASLYYRSIIYLYTNEMDKAYADVQRGYLLDTTDSPFASILSSMDFYFENFQRARRLGLVWWKKNYTENGKTVNWLDYERFEYGYFLKYLDENPQDELAVNTFDYYMHQDLSNRTSKAIDSVESYAETCPDSLFALRLRLYAHMKDRKSKSWVYKALDNKVYSEPLKINGLSRVPKDKLYLFDEVLEKDSTVLSVYWQKSFYQLEQANFLKAIQTASRAIALDETPLSPHSLHGIASLFYERYEVAARDLTMVMDHVPAPQNFYGLVALANFKAGNYEEAAKYNKKIFDFRQSENDLLNQALCYQYAGMPDSAIVYYKVLSNRSPLNYKITNAIVQLYKEKGDYAKALATLEEARKLEYSDFMLIVDMADLYVELGAYDMAIRYYEEAFQYNKDYTYAILGAADCYAAQQDYKTAIGLYDWAVKTKPDHAYSYLAKALCLTKLKKYQESVEAAYKAVELDDEYADAYRLLSSGYFELGRYSVSVSMGLKALKYDPGNKEILYQLAAATLARGNIGEATALYERVLAMEEEAGTDAFKQAIETLNELIAKNIHAEEAKAVLETVFEHGQD